MGLIFLCPHAGDDADERISALERLAEAYQRGVLQEAMPKSH